jgi:hypothetical protein
MSLSAKGDETRRIELSDQRLDLLEVSAAFVGAHVAFVRNAPGKDRRVIRRFCSIISVSIWRASAMNLGLPSWSARACQMGISGTEQDSMGVGVLEHLLVLRVVDGPGERGVQDFQVVVVVLDGAGGFREAFPGRFLVAGHAGEADLLSIEVEMPVADFDFAVAEVIGIGVEAGGWRSRLSVARIA